MLSEDRTFHYLGRLNIKRSLVFKENNQPKDDKVNWLFLKLGEEQFSFVYRIEEPLTAVYERPFNISLSFLMIERVKELIKLNFSYQVLRGEEIIGTIEIIDSLI